MANQMANSSPRYNKSSEPSLAKTVWTAGALIFGDRWIVKHGAAPAGEWNNVFMSFNAEQIAKGIQRMRQQAESEIKTGEKPWPPTAFEFAIYCKSSGAAYHREYKSLPKPRPSKEFAREQLAKMREKL